MPHQRHSAATWPESSFDHRHCAVTAAVLVGRPIGSVGRELLAHAEQQPADGVAAGWTVADTHPLAMATALPGHLAVDAQRPELHRPHTNHPCRAADHPPVPSAPDPAPDPQTDPAETDADEVLVEDLPETNNEDQEVISADDQDADDAVASIDVEAIDVEQELLKEPDDDNQNGEGAADSDVAGSNAETDQQSTQQPALDSEPSSQPESAETAANSDLPEQSSEKSKISSAENDDETASAVAPIAIEPEQSPEEDHSPDLNGQVSPDITGASTDAEAHHEEAETSGSEQGDPEQPSQPPPGGA